MSKSIQSVSIAGAGNVATHLGKELQRNGVQINCVYSRNQQSADTLAQLLNCDAVSEISEVPESDLILLCVSDDAIATVLSSIPEAYAVAYTSGSVALDQLPAREDLGVFYPLQTFSKQKEVNLFEVPFLIEATNGIFAQSLFDLAWKVSSKVQFASSETRRHLHLGAVFVNNFTNHMAFIAKEYLEKQQLDWELLKPLMQETFEKLKTKSPFEAQTGPARRNDERTIAEHISMLHGVQKEIYEVISRSIRETYK